MTRSISTGSLILNAYCLPSPEGRERVAWFNKDYSIGKVEMGGGGGGEGGYTPQVRPTLTSTVELANLGGVTSLQYLADVSRGGDGVGDLQSQDWSSSRRRFKLDPSLWIAIAMATSKVRVKLILKEIQQIATNQPTNQPPTQPANKPTN
ncbi:hypothetical protein M0802_011796 [Mischocyttarus mexicanus]|nr:hypothetical protein M0802_011796 [Mischocyttarus mexicanus]